MVLLSRRAMVLLCLFFNHVGMVMSFDDPKQVGYPDPLVTLTGKQVTTAEVWRTVRRPELMELFSRQMYGVAPGQPTMRVHVVEGDAGFLGGKAVRHRVMIELLHEGEQPAKIDVMLVLPQQASVQKPCPVFVGLNFCGNHGVHGDTRIPLSTKWMAAGPGVVNHRATEGQRGVQASRWPLEAIIAQGYGVATAYYGDLEEDHVEGWKTGVRSLYPVEGAVGDALPGQGWGAIGAWAWGLSRIMDMLEQQPGVDAQRVIVHGHSRLGKTALWAGASDKRFAMVISNNSGEGGAALARRLQGKRTADLNRVFPHWFCKNFRQYSQHEEKLPFDQHELLACIAPRPVYITSASDDAWADPQGEFLAGVHAEPVYRLLGRSGLGTTQWPAVNTPVGSSIRYHVRQGKHDVTVYDWEQWMKAAAVELGGK